MSKANWKVKEPKLCIFCGGRGMSKEHIWSDWMGPLFPTSQHHNQFLIGSAIAIHEKTAVLTPQITQHRGAMHQRKVRKVCKTCNETWMSRIVNSAKPWVEKGILGKEASLDRKTQRALAGWVALTAIMAEYTDQAHMGITQDERVYLKANGEPPASWTISVGRCVATEWKPHRYRHIGGATHMGNQDALFTWHLQLTAIALGSLAIFVCSSTSAGAVHDYRAGVSRLGVEVVWPLTHDRVDLPCKNALDNEEMNHLSDGFALYVREKMQAAVQASQSSGQKGS